MSNHGSTMKLHGLKRYEYLYKPLSQILIIFMFKYLASDNPSINGHLETIQLELIYMISSIFYN